MGAAVRILLGSAAGGLVGFLYYRLVGCRTGACPSAGNPWISTSWWALIGGLLASGIK
jgi:hypothetical protein